MAVLSQPLVRAIRFHHCPGKSDDTGFSVLTAVHAANYIEHEQNDRYGARVGGMLDMEYLERLGCADRVELWRRICTDNNWKEEDVESTVR